VYEVEPQDVQVFADSDDPGLEAGDDVVVLNRFLGTWTGGFRVAEVLPDGYRLQRYSDNLIFPDVFPGEDVHSERRHGIRGSHLDRRREPGRWLPAPEELDPQDQWLLVPTETEDD
jgi:hypothetical protein